MVSHKIFKRVLKEYFRYILIIEKDCGYECCIHIPSDSIWFNLANLHDYFQDFEISYICYKYFRKIDPNIQRDILQQFPKLEPYFDESLWFQKNEPPSPISLRHFPIWTSKSSKLSVTNLDHSEPSSSDASTEIYSYQNSPIGSRENSPIRTTKKRKLSNQQINSTSKRKKVSIANKSSSAFNDDYLHQPSTSGYRPPVIYSFQNSPTGSRENSPIPISIPENNLTTTKRKRSSVQTNNATNKRKKLSIQQHDSVNETENEVHVIKQPRRYNFRQKAKKAISHPQKTAQPKRKYKKRAKGYAHLNELPPDSPPLRPHESNLILQSIDGTPITDLNIPLPVCKKIRTQCLNINPITKRYTAYEDDDSENIPLNIYLKM